MLLNLHIKNIALIKEVDLDLTDGLNILSGETGAGKSLLLGSLNIALGGRMNQDLIRHGENDAFVELVFSAGDKKTEEMISAMGIEPEDGIVTISRRLVRGKTISRMNGVSVTAQDIKKVASGLLDIHGQHENQSLLNTEKQLLLIDGYAGREAAPARDAVRELYRQHKTLEKELESYDMDEAARLREKSLLEHEISEIRSAAIKKGEEEELEAMYRKMSNGRKIVEACEAVRAYLADENGASDLIGRAAREISAAAEYDEALDGICRSLFEVESILSDVSRETSSYMEDMNFSESDFYETEARLDLIRSVMAKYGRTYEEITGYAAEAEKRLEFLEEYENRRLDLLEREKKSKQSLEDACEKLSAIRKKAACAFAEAVKNELKDLNFNRTEFEVVFSKSERCLADGNDCIAFHISLNPGEPLLPLSEVASGGELSRIMLAIRTLMADKDSTETLIFDEIDTGISGITAQKVAEKMAVIAKNHQLICVTHLAQIASMADSNYIIEKASDEDSTVTTVRRLNEAESAAEVARMLGGTGENDPAMINAKDMIERARTYKASVKI